MSEIVFKRSRELMELLALPPETTRAALMRAVAESRTLVARGRPGFDDAIDVDNVVELLPSGPVRARERPVGRLRSLQPQLLGREPRYLVQVLAVLCADDNGDNASSKKITKAMLENFFQGLTNFYAPAGIQFTFNPAQDTVELFNTMINQDFTVPASANLDAEAPPMSAAAIQASFDAHNAARSAWARDNHRGKLVIYFRAGTRIDWHQNSGKWIVSSGKVGAFSGTEHEFAAMNQMPELLLAAHELGHYFHLAHTHSGATELSASDKALYPDPDNFTAHWEGRKNLLLGKVRERIRSYVDDHNHPAEAGLEALNADGLLDTPPDSGPQLILYVHGNSCSPMPVEVTVALQSGNRAYTVSPDQDNIMSYFFRCSGAKHFSNQQIDKMRRALEQPAFAEPHILSRHHLIA
ncbi:MAG: hypothetical protein ACK2UK_11245 [Candidatus Promineifilaceae bacterium]